MTTQELEAVAAEADKKFEEADKALDEVKESDPGLVKPESQPVLEAWKEARQAVHRAYREVLNSVLEEEPK